MHFQNTFLFFGFSSAVVIDTIKWGILSDLFGDNVKFFNPSSESATVSLLKNNTNFEQLLVNSKVIFTPESSISKEEFKAGLIKHRNQYVESVESRLLNPNQEKIYNFFLKIQTDLEKPKYNPKPIQEILEHINPETLPRVRAFFATFSKTLKDPRMKKSIEAFADKGFGFKSNAVWEFYDAIKKVHDQYGLLPKEFTEEVIKAFKNYNS
ncbi:hypothetical protein DSO57_1007405 [Entomophthora muscae]|uniref:Uncharacterized protein n=1 Tax=Entomophthora muscae TaxID=34485 RepID=A0ACC2SK33_9FUNG|nr:hypothetical protein DSO57_1007405 [Entomophthora muscae]